MKWLKNLLQWTRRAVQMLDMDHFSRYMQIAHDVVSDINVAAPNKTLTEMIAVYEKFGLPLSEAMRGGLSPDEVKMLLGRAAVLLLKRKVDVSTTKAQMIVHAAYEDSRPA